MRGDGMTTATTDKPDVTALAAVATHSSFSSSLPVLHARTSHAAASAAFFLFKVCNLNMFDGWMLSIIVSYSVRFDA